MSSNLALMQILVSQAANRLAAPKQRSNVIMQAIPQIPTGHVRQTISMLSFPVTTRHVWLSRCNCMLPIRPTSLFSIGLPAPQQALSCHIPPRLETMQPSGIPIMVSFPNFIQDSTLKPYHITQPSTCTKGTGMDGVWTIPACCFRDHIMSTLPSA